MLDALSKGLRRAVEKIVKRGYIDSKVVEELVRDIQRSLLTADVNVKLVFELSERIKKRSLEEKPAPGMTEKEHVIKIVFDELVRLMGTGRIELRPGRIMLVGLFGSGKTTSAGKLGLFFKKKGFKVALVGCDVHRPAAMDQIRQIAEKVKLPCYAPGGNDAVKIAAEGLKKFSGYDIIIFDTSGRNSLDSELAEELKRLKKTIEPDEIILVVPADLGQAAGIQAEGFEKLVGITGIFLTKLDSTAKGGGAITSCAVTGAPIKFIGTGEYPDAIEVFEPEPFVSRLLGFGDLKGLLEKAKETVGEEKLEESAEKFMSGKFTLTDFYDQIKSLQSMGPLKSIVERLPGFVKFPKELDFSKEEEKLKKWQYAIQSMTPEERENPEIIDASRIKRIAKGSGVDESIVRELLKSYRQAKKLSKKFRGRGFRMLGRWKL